LGRTILIGKQSAVIWKGYVKGITVAEDIELKEKEKWL
jgi:hypothetical protein